MKHRTQMSMLLAGLVLGASVAFGVPERACLGRTQSSRNATSLPSSSPLGMYTEADPDPRASVSGSVRSKSGRPLSHAMVCAFCAQCDTRLHGNEPSCVQPDASGRYVVPRLAPGEYLLSASADAHQPCAMNAGKPIHIAGKDVRGQDAELVEGGARLAGVVHDATGGTVAGAIVQANFSFDPETPGRLLSQVTRSDADGAFSLAAREGPLMLIARADGYSEANLPSYAPAQNLSVTLTPSSRITGRVLARPDSKPIAGLRVIAQSGTFRQSATSDADGTFAIDGLRPGVYGIEASGQGWIGRHSGTVTLDISDGARDVIVPVIKAVGITGRIRVGDAPCIAGTAYLSPARGQSLPNLYAFGDLAGNVEFEAVPAGKYQSAARCDGYTTQPGPTLDVHDTPIADVRWTFERGVDLTVRARTPEGIPVEGAFVQVSPQAAAQVPSAPLSSEMRQAQSDKDGRIAFAGLHPGSYTVTGPEVSAPVSLDLETNNSPVEIVVTMKPVGAIEVTVKDREGNPNDQVNVSAAPRAGGPEGGVARPRGDGRYFVSPLAAGDYVVELRDGINPLQRATPDGRFIEVRSGSVTQVEAVYGGDKGRITGRVLDSEGAPIENAWVGAQPSNVEGDQFAQLFAITRGERRSLTDAQGRFAIDALNADAVFTVVASHSLGGESRLDGIHAGQNVDLVLAAPGRLGGVVLTSEGRAPDYFRILINNRSNGQQLMPEFGPDADGKWSVDHVDPGTVEIRAQAPGGVAEATRQLAPAQELVDLRLELTSQEIGQRD